MKVTGAYPLPGSPSQVWFAMINPCVLKATIPGCEWVEPKQELQSPWPEEFAAGLAVRIGPIKPHWTVDIKISDISIPLEHTEVLATPRSWQIDVTAQGTSGYLSGCARVSLEANPNDPFSCTLNYEAGGNANGPIAKFGSKLLGHLAPKLANHFFKKFAEAISERPSL